MPQITVAENAGFCFGVKRATDRLQECLRNAKAGEKICTLGHLIHNESYNAKLREQKILTVEESDLKTLAVEATKDHPVTVLVRAHGCTKQTEILLNRLAEQNPNFRWLDCTCPYVRKIHKIAAENAGDDRVFLLIGAKEHPEVIGIMSFFEGEKHVFESANALESYFLTENAGLFRSKVPIMAAQTTLNLDNWNQSQKVLKKHCTNAIIFDTICSVTDCRQSEAQALSKVCDGMVVIGGRESSNTAKLFEICLQNCPLTVWIASAAELDRRQFVGAAHIGIVAGASTPSNEIQEVYKTMSEIENFEELLEAHCATLNTGDVVTGIVTSVSDAELQLDLGTGVTGIIKAEKATADTSRKLTEQFKKGDKVEGFVIRVSDIDGVAELDKLRVDSDKHWDTITNAYDSKEILDGTVAEAVKGGVVVYCNCNRVFIPASQTNVPKDGDLTALVGSNVSFRIIEVKPGKKAIGSIALVQKEEKKAKAAEFWANVEVGKVYTGMVDSLTNYGAFVDLGGVDGMVHVTELSWKHIHHPKEVVSVGDMITVFVKSFDPEKKRVSLGYKKEDENPWTLFKSRYAVGDIASVKIVNLMPFGAFAEILDGVDGLIHISQISMERIGKPADVLSIGQVVDARIVEIDDEKQKVSLSIRSILEEQQAEAEAMPAEEAPVEQ